MSKPDWALLLELGDGRKRKPLTGGKRIDPRIQLPDWGELLEIDRQAEAAAELAIPGPQLPRGAVGAVKTTSDT